jgi:diguanylate cyclase (GGDEF)-like protein
MLLDTSVLARWVARNRHAKVDEAIVVGFVFVCLFGIVAVRRWLGASWRLSAFHRSLLPSPAATPERLRASFRRDLVGVAIALVLAVVAVAALDTGDLAAWIAQQSHTRVDEAIVSAFMLMAGLSFFSIRRWLELSDELLRSQELQQRTTALNREITTIGELSDLLQSCRSTEEAQALVTERARTLFPDSSGALCITNHSRNLVDAVATWGTPALAESFFSPDDCWALRRGRIHVFDGQSVSCAHIAEARPARALCVPMMAHGETLGLLYVEGGVAEPWSDSERRLARTLAEQAALALANLTLREKLRLQSVRDPLTGLHNRRYLEESLEREIQRAERRSTSVGVLMIDLDHFKRLNDTFGHDAGDTMLCALADLFRTRFRGEDIVCRYGGEEFTILLPETSLARAQERAEELRAAAAEARPPGQNPPIDPVTLSIGVACYPQHGDTGAALLHAADAALYRAKAQGRDRVVMAA